MKRNKIRDLQKLLLITLGSDLELELFISHENSNSLVDCIVSKAKDYVMNNYMEKMNGSSKMQLYQILRRDMR